MTAVNEGKSNDEIKAECNCSQSTVTRARNILKKEEPEPEYDATDDEINTEYSTNFIKQIKIEPDPDTLTDKKEEKVKSFDVECPECQHEWSVKSDEHIDSCPSCGCEFE